MEIKRKQVYPTHILHKMNTLSIEDLQNDEDCCQMVDQRIRPHFFDLKNPKGRKKRRSRFKLAKPNEQQKGVGTIRRDHYKFDHSKYPAMEKCGFYSDESDLENYL